MSDLPLWKRQPAAPRVSDHRRSAELSIARVRRRFAAAVVLAVLAMGLVLALLGTLST